MGSVVAAYGVGWTAIAIYLLTLAARQRRLSQSVAALGEQIRAGSRTHER